MGEYNNILPASIRSILTLRYDSTLKPLLPKLDWKDFVESPSTNETEYVEDKIMQVLQDEIGTTNRISISLSGGIDSTLMLALLRKSFPDIVIDAISIKFAESIDESIQAKKIAEQFNANHKTIYIDNYLRELPQAISIIGLPFWDLHWYHVAKEAESTSKLLVSGDGGDELFAGYTFRYEKFLSLINENSSPKEKTIAYLKCHERDWVPDQEKLFGKKIPFSWEDIYSIILPYFENSLPPIAQVFLADYNGKLLYNWLPLNTKFHQYFGLKAVTPLLSKDIISFATHIPYHIKYDKKNNIGKLPLRQILSKYVKNSDIVTKKQGFSVNTVNFWKSHGQEMCNYYLSDGRIIREGLVNGDWITKTLEKLKSEPDMRYVNKFLGLLSLEIWFRLFITKEMKPTQLLD